MADWYSETYYQNSPISNPLGPDFGLDRVIRGGNFYHDPYGVRVYSRGWDAAEGYYFSYGFRCARDAP